MGTYLQYREWKRVIRADAACRIQALCRGVCTRMMLLRSKDPKVRRVVRIKAGLSIVSNDKNTRNKSVQGQGNKINQSNRPPKPNHKNEQNCFCNKFLTQARALFPRRGTQIVRRRSDLVHENEQTPPISRRLLSIEYSNLSLVDLQTRKRELKQQLKQYDMNFARRHGRMPVNAEKEPIRHLYENYNLLKIHINILKQEGRHTNPSSTPNVNLSQRSVSTASTNQTSESRNEETIRRGNRNTRRLPPKIVSISPSQHFTALNVEKEQLHQMLRSYEKDCFREHRHQVIGPVASQYRRYKETKRVIAIAK